eukprot:COSAG01_NODE_4727_length_4789_cov_2.948188_1_plen_110_part_10
MTLRLPNQFQLRLRLKLRLWFWPPVNRSAHIIVATLHVYTGHPAGSSGGQQQGCRWSVASVMAAGGAPPHVPRAPRHPSCALPLQSVDATYTPGVAMPTIHAGMTWCVSG